MTKSSAFPVFVRMGLTLKWHILIVSEQRWGVAKW